MPIEYEVDHDRRLVLAKGKGHLVGDDFFGYQKSVWSRPDVAGYDEVVDMSEVENVELPVPGNMRELAALSASMDHETTPTKFAIVAPKDLEFGLGRMYEAYRALNKQSKKEVAVFRTMEEAMIFLKG